MVDKYFDTLDPLPPRPPVQGYISIIQWGYLTIIRWGYLSIIQWGYLSIFQWDLLFNGALNLLTTR